tara:strand:+ start:22376 stop:24094 length:1719 start_codon:yes stop_codon:yes gene_type:complete
MTNIRNFNFTGLDYRVSNSEYYDFYLNTDGYNSDGSFIGDFDTQDYDNQDWLTSPIDAEQYLVSSFNFNYYYENSIPQITNVEPWVGAVVSSLTATTYGLTGLDNGKIYYDSESDGFGHLDLLDKLTGSTLTISANNKFLTLDKVSGYTGSYAYPIEQIITTASTGNYAKFCGGFYQGFYKLDGFDYEVLPNRYQKGWSIETWLNKSDTACSGTTGTTLNDTYPDNKGFFYYIGTRAENKFWNIFTGNTTSCTSGSTDFCMDVKEIDVDISNITVDGSGTTVNIPLSPPPVDVKLVNNQFLIFGRSNGKLCANTSSPDGFGQVRADRSYTRQPFYSDIVRQEVTNTLNPFLIYGRSNGKLCSNTESADGYGQVRAGRDFSGNTADVMELDKEADIIGNALGFRIKDDGSIGYRMLTLSADCSSVEVIEEYSLSGMVTDDQWEHIAVKWVNNDTYNGCDLINGKVRRGRFKFYLNSNLIFVSKELDEFIPKRLDDFQEKQLGVPYNISIGGGTQGLVESMTFDGQDPEDLGLIIEQNFAGSFIGSISLFNIYEQGLNWCEIKELYKSRVSKYK